MTTTRDDTNGNPVPLTPTQKATLLSDIGAQVDLATATPEQLAAAQGAFSGGFGAANMAAWNRAKARVRAGVADAVVLYLGDSTVNGQGAGDNPTGNFTNAENRASPARFAQSLTAMGLPASSDAVFGSHLMDSQNAALTTLPLYNPKLTIAASGQTEWFASQLLTVGGSWFQNSTGSGAFSLTPNNAFNAVDVYTVKQSSGGNLPVAVGATNIGTINTNSGPTLIGKDTLTTGGAAAAGTINFTRGSGTTSIVGIIPRSTTTRRVQVINAGWGGSQSGDWASDAASATYQTGLSATGAWRPAKGIEAISPDLTIINLGANDIFKGTSVAQSMSNLSVLIASAKLGGGSVVLVIPTPQNPATRDPSGLTAAFNAAVWSLAKSTSCGVIDMYSRMVSWDASNALGYYADSVHGLPILYSNVGDFVARAAISS